MIPLRLSNCLIPRRLKDKQYIDYFSEEHRLTTYSRLLSSFKIRAKQLGIRSKASDQDLLSMSHIDEFKLYAREFFGQPYGERQVSAEKIRSLSAKFELAEIIKFALSLAPGERVACGVALGEKISKLKALKLM